MYHAGDDPNKIYFSNFKDGGVDFNACFFSLRRVCHVHKGKKWADGLRLNLVKYSRNPGIIKFNSKND